MHTTDKKLQLKRKRRLGQGCAFLLLTALFATACSFGPGAQVNAASSVKDLQSKYDQLEEQQQQIQKEIKNIQNQQDQTEKQATYLADSMAITQQQIDLMNSKIDACNGNIAQKESEIAQKQQEIDAYYEQFKKRLRAMYVTTPGSDVELLFESQSFTDFLTRAEYVKNTADHDKKLLEQMREDKRVIESAKTELEQSKAEVEQSKKNVDAKLNSLDGQMSQNEALSKSLEKSEAEKKAAQQKLTNELNKINEEIERMIAASKVENGYVGGEFLWPMPGYNNLTSYFGWRVIDGINDYHTGIDIAGANIYGKNILAANDGVVSYVKFTSGGYGRHLLIDHGGGTYTLYAHTSYIGVSTGEQVKKGQVIGRVGNSGWSSGPHLHFEIWINKQRVNPLNFFSKG